MLTSQQRQAITARSSVALSAGAGCGKTFVLTERFLGHLQPNEQGQAECELQQLVAITYTERAAREMRDRVRRRAHDYLLAADTRSADYWLALLRRLDTARISTIHAFCTTLLRSHAVETGLDPRFTVADEIQAQALRAEVEDLVLRELLAQEHPALLDLLTLLQFSELRRHLASLRNTFRTTSLDEWRQQLAGDGAAEAAAARLVDRWQQFWHEQHLPGVIERVAAGPEATRALELLADETPGHPQLRQSIDWLREQLPRWREWANPAAMFAQVCQHARVSPEGSRASAKHWSSPEQYAAIRDALDELRERAAKSESAVLFDRAAALRAAQHGLQMFDITLRIEDRYTEQKRDLGWLDFDDLISHARRLLLSPEHQPLVERLRRSIRWLLVDEFQDTDPVQVELVRVLCGSRLAQDRLFFVGDAKQSIYRFRGADPTVSRALELELPPGARLPLSRNFRSQPAILHFINALFVEALGREATGEDYEPLQPHRRQQTPEPTVEFLWAVPPTETDDSGKEAPNQADDLVDALRRREARWIARRLRQLLDSEEPLVALRQQADDDSPHLRAARPGDIAILFRSLSDVAIYEDALREHDLDYYLVGGHAFYSQQEIFDLVNLLRTLVSPADQLSLAGVLRSPFFSLSDETLFWLAQSPGGLAAAMTAADCPPQVVDDQRLRVQHAARTLDELRGMKDRLPIARLIQEALARTGYDAAVLVEFLGSRKLANLHKLIDLARKFDAAAAFTLSDFIVQLSEFVALEPKEPLAATHPESSDVIRLMTIHQAKGLEFPIVVLPDLNRKDTHDNHYAWFHPDLGPLVNLRNKLPRDQQTEGVVGFDLGRAQDMDAETAERVRLLYVATTRPADYLILSAGLKHPQETKSSWLELLGKRFDLETGDLRAPLPPGYALPQIRVTTSEPPLAREPHHGGARQQLDRLIERVRSKPSARRPALPVGIAPVPADPLARRAYSFSQLFADRRPPGISSATDRVDHQQLRSYELSDDDVRAPGTSHDASALDLGSLVHAVLAAIDYRQPASPAELVHRHAEQLGGLDDEIVARATELVTRFLRSARANELASATARHHEIDFLLAWPPEDPTNTGPYLHGVIDCLYLSADGRWHLLDFKTNALDRPDVAAWADHYQPQLLLYALATETAMHLPPADLALHFLVPGAEVVWTWDDRRRATAREQIDQALRHARTPTPAAGSI